jgi:release factor glutamine methyltransferase
VRDDVVDRLTAAGCVAARAEAAELLAAAPDDETLDRWLTRREQGEPLAWITGSVVFCGRRVVVAPGVYVPRPQTEALARRAVACLPPGGLAVDLCTGSGAVAAHLAASVPSATVVGVDVDERAASCARRNGVAAVVSDLDAAFRAQPIADVVTAVAPYVPTGDLAHLPRDVVRYEPRPTLDGGDDGLDVVRRVVGAAARLVREGGRLLVELGGDQDARLAPALHAAGFDRVEPWSDDEGDLRGLVARRGARRGGY